jgi:hypothetical protein
MAKRADAVQRFAACRAGIGCTVTNTSEEDDMTASEIDDILRRSDPWAYNDAVALAATEFAAETRIASAASARRRTHRAAWLAPLAILGGTALTAGALVATDNLLHEDLPIAIGYTTDTGRTISCTATIEGGSFFAPREAEVVQYYREHDFTGIGQRIYDYAMVLAGEREQEPGLLPRSSLVVADDKGNPYPEPSAFSYSLTSFLLTDAYIDLGIINGTGDSWLSSDCTGELH